MNLQKILDEHDALLVETDTNSKSFTLDKKAKDNIFKKINMFIISNDANKLMSSMH